MRQNKWTIYITFPITVVALAGAWCLDVCEEPFWSNVLLGVFGSALLTLLVSCINYATERRKALEDFWTLGHKAVRAFNRYPLDGSLDEKADAILLINEFDFAAFGDAYSAIDFLFGNKKGRNKIYTEIYLPIREAGHTVLVNASQIIRLRRYAPENKKVLEIYITNVDNKLIKQETITEDREDGQKLEMRCISNFLADHCLECFDGFYWRIMYPLRSRKKASE